MALVMMILVMLIYMLFVFISMSMEKEENCVSPYECGFDPSMGARVPFSYRFFLISILFLVFDVEITLLLPLPYEMVSTVLMGGFVFFIMVMLGGLIYEYFNGVLTWVI